MIYKRIRHITRNVSVRYMQCGNRSFSISNHAVIDKALKDGELRVFIVAGEVSGDSIGSRFMNSLKKLSPTPVKFCGVGGCMMSKQGLSYVFPMEDISVMGIWELLPHLYKFRVRLKQAISAALSFRPHVVVTVDSKGFSFRFLKEFRVRCAQQGFLGPPHFHYVAPSFWAWKGGEARLKNLSSFVDHVLCILPFEAETCRSHGLDATFVGHPTFEDALDFEGMDRIVNRGMIQGHGEEFKIKHGISSGSTVISILPGSRLLEVTRMLPIFSEAMKLLSNSFPNLVTVIHVAPNHHVEEYLAKEVRDWPTHVVLIPGGSPNVKYNSFIASKVALCTSGTVAMELQLARLPCVVAYRAHFVTEWVIQQKAKVPYISLPNILLDSAVIPEVLFQACTPSLLASSLADLMSDNSLRDKQINTAEKVIRLVSPPDCNPIVPDSAQHSQTPSMVAASTVLHSKVKSVNAI